MADEITLGGSLSINKAGKKASMSGTDKRTMTGDRYIQRVDNIGAVEESVGKGDIGTLGYCFFKNVGTSGIIQLGGVTGAYVLKIDPGESVGPIKWATNAIFAVCDVAGTSNLEMLLVEL